MFTRRSWLKVAAVSAVAAASAIFGYIAGYNASVKVERSLYQPALKTVKLPPASKKVMFLWRRLCGEGDP